jgi:hypothetical protein
MTHDYNLLLEQYNLAQLVCDGDLEDYYWEVAEWIERTMLTRASITKHDILDILCDILEVSEEEIDVDNVDDFLTAVYESSDD